MVGISCSRFRNRDDKLHVITSLFFMRETLADVFVVHCRKGKLKENQQKINSVPHLDIKSALRESSEERKFNLGGSWHVMSSFSVMNTSMNFS